MRHRDISAAAEQEHPATRAASARAPDRPDLRDVRGNQDTDHADVERGREKLDRVLGK